MSEDNRIGLLGGSFNPVHMGHLRAAEVVRESFSLNKIVFIPAAVNPLKTDEDMSNAAKRLEMLKIATEGNPCFEISDIEIKRGGNSYTIDTLTEFNNTKPGNSYYFIMGSELFSNIETWKDYKRLFDYSNFIVVRRPGTSTVDMENLIPLELANDFRYVKHHNNDNDKVIFEHSSSNRLYFVTIQGFELSSTMIRDLVKKGSSIKYLVPEKLEKYIITNRIYTEAV